MRILLIAGNWKMNKTPAEGVKLIKELKELTKNSKNVEIVVCPSFVALSDAADELKESKIKLGAQDMFWEKEGAYTGEVSAAMLKAVGCKYVIIGHSERRQHFNESNDNVNKKVIAALHNGLDPIVCVGERLEERESMKTMFVIENQIRKGLNGLNSDDMKKVTIAYEPVWAIGTGKNATPQQAQEIHYFIRGIIAEMFDKETAKKIRIIYGGSVKPDNISDLMLETDVDGALVGGASLKAEDFAKIADFGAKKN